MEAHSAADVSGCWTGCAGRDLYRGLFLVLRFRSSCHVGIHFGPHPEEHRASDASRRMATSEGRAGWHPSRRKPSPFGQRLAPQDEDRELGNDRFRGIGRVDTGILHDGRVARYNALRRRVLSRTRL